MEKGSYSQESAPPYPGPPMEYGQPAMYAPPAYSTQLGFPAQPGYPPQPSYPAAPAGHHAVTPVPVSTVLSDVPGQTFCVHCQQTVVTHTKRSAGLLAWVICAGLCLFGCWLCCSIPFCLDSCNDVTHHCPRCHHVLYIYKRL
ncbi:LITAF domain-containing protein-like [Poeciliopsis prolifica]|uniref:LITAF domain-containing protein-like n=1 Tax=Poeciliopsis prolifica TaxID=188132 RepID=UPI0024135FFA|nr:LITAF domain-containing protein-like [Poeciliopsis prolifica]